MKKIAPKYILLITFCIALTIPVCLGKQPSRAEKMDSLLTMLNKQNQFNGNVLVAENGKILLNRSYGLRDESTGQKLNSDTIFDLASVSKQFTAMGIVLLKEQKKLSYDDEIREHIPELEHYKGITIRHLLNHTSGIPNYMPLFRKKWDPTKIATNQDVLNVFQTYEPKMLFRPASKFRYSNTGYAVLASIIERASGTNYASFLSKHIFTPLKMKNTFVYNRRLNPKKISNLAVGYTFSESHDTKISIDNSTKANHFRYLGGIVGDGAINSNVVDLLRWDRSLYKNKLVSARSMKEIYSPSQTSDGKTNQYGFGWSIRRKTPYGRVLNHSGSWAGFVTYLERHIDTDKTIIILQNFDKAVLPIKNLREILYNQQITKLFRKEIKIDPAVLAEYSGDYVTKSDPDSVISISKGENYIIYNATEQKWNMRFYPETDTSFFSKNARFDIQISFVKNALGQDKILLYQNKKIIEEGLKRK